MRGLVVTIIAALAGAAAADGMHVFAPDGWVPDRSTEQVIAGLPGARVFHPPGDLASKLIAGDARMPPGSPAKVVATMLDQIAINAQKIESRTERTDDGRTIGEISLVDHGGMAIRARVVAMTELRGEAIELAVGLCLGPAVAECAPKLAWITVGTNRPTERDDAAMWRIAIIVLGIALGVGTLTRIARRLRRAKSVAGSAPLREHEHVTITGVVRPIGERLEAPLTGRACVLYRARARVFTRGAMPSPLGEPAETRCVPFAIATSRGEVIVETSPTLDAAMEAIVERTAAKEIAFLSRHGFGADLHGASTFDELVLQPGTTVKVRGVVHLERDANASDERGYRDDAPVIAKLVGVEGTPLVLLETW